MKKVFLSFLVSCLALVLTGCSSCSKKTANTNANSNTAAKPTPTPFEGDAQTVFNKGLELQKNDQDAAAARAFEQVIKMDADFTEAYIRLGMTYTVLGKEEKAEAAYKKAIDVYKKFVDKNPNDAKAYYYLGWAYSENKKTEEAERALVKATSLQKDYVDALYELGVVRIRLAKYPEAVAALKKSPSTRPERLQSARCIE